MRDEAGMRRGLYSLKGDAKGSVRLKNSPFFGYILRAADLDGLSQPPHMRESNWLEAGVYGMRLL